MNAGIKVLERATSVQEARAGVLFPYILTLLADAHGRAGDPEQGLALLPEAIALMEKAGACLYDALLHRVRGDLLLQMQLPSEAEKSLCHAVQLARGKGAYGWEFRAALSLAELYRAQGRVDDARRELEERLAAFTEGFETRDLREAQRLIAEMAA